MSSMLAACLSFAACPILAAGSARLTLSGAPQWLSQRIRPLQQQQQVLLLQGVEPLQ